MTNSYHQAPDSIAAAPAGCPVHETWSPLSKEYLADPYPIAAKLRDDHPVFYSAELGYVVVTRMEDIDSVFMDSDTYASTNVQDPLFPMAPEAGEILSADDFNPTAVMSNRPEPDHARIRAFTRPGFSVRRLKTLEDYMRTMASARMDDMLASGKSADYVSSVAFPLPAEIVFRFIGFPPEDDLMLKSWCVNRKAFSWGQPTAEEQASIAEGMLDYWRYTRAFVAKRYKNRADDFCSEMLDHHDADPDPSNGTGISYLEVESVIYGLSFAGHDPVTNLLTNTLRCLLPRREQWDAVCQDPDLINNAIEEVLRYESSQIAWRRVTTKPTTLGGIDLPTGTRIFLNFAAANHQPDLFDQPTSFDLNRDNSARHISFGKGIHFCLGANLSRMEARIALELISQKAPSLRLADQEFSTFPNITFRGPEELIVEWA
ncbi:MAG: cytochrome P450 [Acidimicrobiales bacterium]